MFEALDRLIDIDDSSIKHQSNAKKYQQDLFDLNEKYNKAERKLQENEKQIKELSQKNAGAGLYFEAKERVWNIERAKLEIFLQEKDRLITESSDPDQLIQEKAASIQIENSSLFEKIEKYQNKLENQKIMINKLQLELGIVKEKLSEQIKYSLEFDTINLIKQREIAGLTLENSSLKEMLDIEIEKNRGLADDLKAQIDIANELKLKVEDYKTEISHVGMEVITEHDQIEFETYVCLDDPIFYKVNSSNSTSIKRKHHTDPNKHKLARPNYAQILGLNTNVGKYSPPFKNWIQVTIRGIYDSKFYEHLLCAASPLRAPTRFLDFVLS